MLVAGQNYKLTWAGVLTLGYTGTYIGRSATHGWWEFRDSTGKTLFINPAHVSNVTPLAEAS